MLSKITRELIFEVIIFLLAILGIFFLWEVNYALAIYLLVLYLIGNYFWHNHHDFIFYAAGFILGPIGQAVAVKSGAIVWSNPSFLGIPIWLPFATGLLVMLIVRITEAFVHIEKKN